ncbi:MAG: hypothetical protein ACOC6O_00385 [Chloroflexota bacterium]
MKLACAADKIKTLAPGEVKAILDKDKKGEFVLLDVRQPARMSTSTGSVASCRFQE